MKKKEKRPLHEKKTIAIIDIGTHAVRLAIAHIYCRDSLLQTYQIVDQMRKVARLGENSFHKGIINHKAMQRTVRICQEFIRYSKAKRAEHIFAFATSAVREAANKEDFINKLMQKTGISLKVLSGKEEAMCVFNALKNGIPKNRKQNTLCIEIGGGSAELAVASGRSKNCLLAEELKIGALRLSEIFLGKNAKQPIAISTYEQMKDYVIKVGQDILKKAKKYAPRVAIGSSGTIRNLCALAGGKRVLSIANIKKITMEIISKNVQERIAMPGIEPDRADILPAGAAILESIMEELKIKQIHLSYYSLRDGLIYEAAKMLNLKC